MKLGEIAAHFDDLSELIQLERENLILDTFGYLEAIGVYEESEAAQAFEQIKSTEEDK